MGNKSSKSVQITTEAAKDTVAEGTGKVEKIEDVDHKPKANGGTELKEQPAATEGVSLFFQFYQTFSFSIYTFVLAILPPFYYHHQPNYILLTQFRTC